MNARPIQFSAYSHFQFEKLKPLLSQREPFWGYVTDEDNARREAIGQAILERDLVLIDISAVSIKNPLAWYLGGLSYLARALGDRHGTNTMKAIKESKPRKALKRANQAIVEQITSGDRDTVLSFAHQFNKSHVEKPTRAIVNAMLKRWNELNPKTS